MIVWQNVDPIFEIMDDPWSLKYSEYYLREEIDNGAHLVDEHKLTNKLDFASSYTVFGFLYWKIQVLEV